MRLWSVHPKYLDTKGLLALWREGLLALAVLEGKTRGYRNHSQLQRFKQAADPVAAIRLYLVHVHAEAIARGYKFDPTKLGNLDGVQVPPMPVTTGQLEYERAHLHRKLVVRDAQRAQELPIQCDVHQMLRVVHGDVEPWEKQ